jgi:hypothetical protein
MPSWVQVHEWAADDERYPEFSEQFAYAREAQIEAHLQRGLEHLESPGLMKVYVQRIGAEGEIVEVRTELNIAQAKALADYRLKMAAMLRDGRNRAGRGVETFNADGDGDGEDRGPVEVIIYGGTPKGRWKP